MAKRKNPVEETTEPAQEAVVDTAEEQIEEVAETVEEPQVEETTEPAQEAPAPVGATIRIKSRSPIPGKSSAAFYYYTPDLKKMEAVAEMVDGVVQVLPDGCTVDDLIQAGFVRF